MKLASKIILTIVILYGSATAVAQEYRYELGVMAGASMYMGDANQTSLTQGWHPSAGIVFRNNLNFRWAFKADLLWGQISGDSRKIENQFPRGWNSVFSRQFFELGAQMEFNFLPYSDKFAYLNTKRYTPYALIGLGVTMAPGNDQTFFNLNLPIGVGFKYKLRNKLNIGIEYTIHKLFGDGFDSLNKKGFSLDNPYKTKQGAFKNNDWYNTLMFSITWEFGVRDTRCM